MKKVEIACNSYVSARHAVQGGANRIELFENLGEGGCTPSAGMIRQVVHLHLPVYVMIRPRAGNFCYTNDEVDIMLQDIAYCKQNGVAGIVFGCLTPYGAVDTELCKLLMKEWNHGPATFHRAIDRSADIMTSCKLIADLGFERILSSGGALNVMDGLDTLKQMNESFGTSVIVMPGAGVTHLNAAHILSTTGCREIHATCKEELASVRGSLNPVFEDREFVSDMDTVRTLVTNVMRTS